MHESGTEEAAESDAAEPFAGGESAEREEFAAHPASSTSSSRTTSTPPPATLETRVQLKADGKSARHHLGVRQRVPHVTIVNRACETVFNFCFDFYAFNRVRD